MLLTNYGFAISRNKFNYCRIKFPLNTLLMPIQLEKLTSMYDVPMCVAFKFKSTYINLKFLQILRSVLWDCSNNIQSFFNPCCLELEEKVLSMAIEKLNEQMLEFETSLEEDLVMMEKPRSHRHYFAVLGN
jgi:hypothetical protein